MATPNPLATSSNDFPDPAVTVYFQVKIDGCNLGAFTTCDGLGCEIVVEQREEGGNNDFVHQLPGRIKYSNVKLTRPINRDSDLVAKWFQQVAAGGSRAPAKITALSAEGSPVAHWTLQDVIPIKWSGPQLSAESPKVAMETLEIAHHGFLPFETEKR
jgi:phage tail-like protein